MVLISRLKDLGLDRLRVALALLALGFFGMLYTLVAMNAPDGWGAAFAALSVCYLTAFVALVCEWFWARWFAAGLGWSGFMVAMAGLVMVGWQPALVMYGGFHGAVVLSLMGQAMAARYEAQTGWRQRFGMDEHGASSLGKTITRAAASLPTVILWALAPKQEQGALFESLASVTVLGLLGLGLHGLVRGRTWGWLAVAGAASAFVATATVAGVVAPLHTLGNGVLPVLPQLEGFTAVLLILAVVPFALPAWRYARSLAR